MNYASSVAGKEKEGHVFLPLLFSDDAALQNSHYPGQFKLVSARVLYVIVSSSEKTSLEEYFGSIDRNTLLLVAPLNKLNCCQNEFAVPLNAARFGLLRTRDIVYNYIGDLLNHGCTNLMKESYIDFARRELKIRQDDIGPANMFVSHSWGDYFCDTVSALEPDSEQCCDAINRKYFEFISFGSLVISIFDVGLYIMTLFVIVSYIFRSICVVMYQVLHPQSWQSQRIKDLSRQFFWIDILGKYK